MAKKEIQLTLQCRQEGKFQKCVKKFNIENYLNLTRGNFNYFFILKIKSPNLQLPSSQITALSLILLKFSTTPRIKITSNLNSITEIRIEHNFSRNLPSKFQIQKPPIFQIKMTKIP